MNFLRANKIKKNNSILKTKSTRLLKKRGIGTFILAIYCGKTKKNWYNEHIS